MEQIVWENSDFKMIKILNYEDAIFWGKNTYWCICNNNPKERQYEGEYWFNYYLKNGTI